MASMNPVRELLAFIRLNWRIIALCLCVAVVSALIASRSRNDHRFEPVAPDRKSTRLSCAAVRELLAFIRLNWRIIALCLCVAVVSALIASRSRNDHRFEPVA